jgi:cytochrome c-type biogenesis protein CcmH
VTPFILICIVMLVAAVAAVAIPLVRNRPAAAKGEAAVPRAKLAFFVLAVGLPLAAAAVYSGVSNFPWQNPSAAAAAPPGHGEDGQLASLQAATAQLEERLKANPEDAEGWRMLGRTYLVTGQAGKAVAAYRRSAEIAGAQTPELKLDLAEALVLTDDPSVQGEAKQIIAATLESDPSNEKALWYQGVMAMRSGDKNTARASFQRLLEENPPPEIRQILVEQLAGLGIQVPAAGAAPTAAGGGMAGQAAGGAVEPAGRTIRVAVSIAPALAAKVAPGTPLFVAARQPGIPGPPLAALRLSSDQLPTTVVLSDANSMIQGRDLSSVDEVEIVAHVALAGTPTVSSGDLVGTARNSRGGSPDVSVVIDQTAP